MHSILPKKMQSHKEYFGEYFNAKMGFSTKRTDNAPVKRVELHTHTRMSSEFDRAVVSAKDLVERAFEWGHEAIAITDGGVVQAFPEAFEAYRSTCEVSRKVKIIYGVEVSVWSEGSGGCFTTLLAKDRVGLKNLYKLVSLSHKEHFRAGIPFIPFDSLLTHRDGLIFGSGVPGSDVYIAIEGGESDERICEVAKFYDFLELDINKSESVNKTISRIGDLLCKPVVAVGNVRYLDPEDDGILHILNHIPGVDNEENQEKCYFRTTEEMLTALEYLGESKAYEVVVANTNLIADMIEFMPPIPDGFFLPTLDGADAEMVQICNTRAKEIYGDNLADNVKERLDHELNSILENGYAAIYMIAQRLVKKSNDAGYIVGSRGNAGSSLVAYLLGITGIDPIKFNIPFETFAGIDGEKIPDIDLNFDGEYQAEIHKYIAELLGKDKVYRAGTISTLREPSAMGIVSKYFADIGITPAPSEVERLASDMIGIKRATGQHPGGLIIVPKDKEIYDFTPVQYPGNNTSSSVLATHFDYHALDNTLLKFDLLGHSDPTMIRRLEKVTGADTRAIHLDDEKTLSMLINSDALGVPEFGNMFVRNIIEIARPKSFDDFVKISGLSHGTGVWCGNAETLIRTGKATISEVIALRDEIMVYLMDKGICRETAYKIMENVRKGRGLSEEQEAIASKSGVPEWYVESCNKISYLFPKAHAVAYTIMAFRIAWFKAHYPEAFYRSYFEVKSCSASVDVISLDIEETQRRIKEIEAREDYAQYDKYVNDNMLPLLKMRLEMLERN